MRKNFSVFLLMGLFVFIMVTIADNVQALVIDFEEYSQTPGSTPSTQGDVTSQGFLFDSSTNHTHFANNFGGGDSGSTFFGSDDFAGTSNLTMSSISGDVFNLLSMDLGNWFEVSDSLHIIGYLSGGGTVSTTIALGGFSTYNFYWSNLVSLNFDSLAGTGDQYYGVDNINLEPIPEPATMLLVGFGLVGLAGVRRKFRKQ